MTATPGAKQAVEAMLGGREVCICAHINPDGDALGSVLGLTAILRAAGVTARPLLADPADIPLTYTFLPGCDELRAAAEDDTCDVLVSLDTTDLARLGAAAPLAESAEHIIVIDHHPDTSEFGTAHVLDPSAAAVGLMLWELLPAFGVEPTPEIATTLYTALMTDTGRFQHTNTDGRALRVAGQMVEAGADPSAIARAVYQSRTPAAVRLIGIIIGRVAHANGGHVAYSWFDPRDLTATGATLGDTEDLVDWVRMEAGPDVALLAKVGEGETRLSLRARNEVDVGAIARTLGGGGHRAAAGATVSGGLEQALERVLPLLPGGGA